MLVAGLVEVNPVIPSLSRSEGCVWSDVPWDRLHWSWRKLTRKTSQKGGVGTFNLLL